jgi:hypothetical protein
MVARFIGGAAGSAVGTMAYAHGGWTGTCVVASVVLLAGTIYHGTSAPDSWLRVAYAIFGITRSFWRSRR